MIAFHKNETNQRGTALITSLLLVLLVSGFAVSYLARAVDRSDQSTQHNDISRLKRAANSTITLAVHRIWGGYLDQQGGRSDNLLSFRTYLNQNGLPAAGLVNELNFDGATMITDLVSLPTTSADGALLNNVAVTSLQIIRTDDPGSTTVLFIADVESTRGRNGQADPLRRRVEQAFVTEDAEWGGLEFGLLANNVNCIMCHTQIDSVDRFYNNDPAMYGSYDRIRVGTLEHLTLRADNGSDIAGTIYVRGNATDKDGVPIANWGAMDFNTALTDGAGKILEDAFGNALLTKFDPADTVNPLPYENLYLDYSMNDETMVDGYLPQSFPDVFPDDGGIDPVTGAPVPGAAGNRIVDASEFAAASASANGSVSGGTIFRPAAGDVITSQNEFTDAFTTGNQDSLAAATTGHVILTGTEHDPIILDGDIAIDGDLIIQGYIVGEGSFRVSGNVYVPSSLSYLDGTNSTLYGDQRSFGTAANGQTNNLAIAAGGSILVGDLFYNKRGNQVTGDESGAYNFVLSELALFNRAEWSKTQTVLPGLGEDHTQPETWTAVNSNYQGPDYLPRYYNMVEGGTVPMYVSADVYFDDTTGTWQGKEHGKDWDSILAHPGDPSDSILYNADGSMKAALHSLSTENGWATVEALEGMMRATVGDSPQGKPLEIDATLYSSNSIFGIVGKNSPMHGKMLVNGGIVAADIGLLAPGNGGTGLNLNYDSRGKQLLDLRSTDRIVFRRKLWVTSGVQ